MEQSYQTFYRASVEGLSQDPSFARWSLSQARPEEVSFWEGFLQEYPDKAEEVQVAKELVWASSGLLPQGKLEAQRKALLRRQIFTKLETTKSAEGKGRALYRRPWFWAAASLALLLGVGGWWWFQPVTIETGYAEARQVTLPDSTQVNLNANSRLSYDRHWAEGEERAVQLDGEAYFRVKSKPHSGAKFVVNTPDLAVVVLGTQFNVQTHLGGTQVVLDEGEVALNRIASQEGQAPAPLAMKPGEWVAYSKETGQTRRRAVAQGAFSTWREGYLEFDQYTLAELGRLITANFGPEVVIQDSALRHRKIAGTAPNDDLELLLEAVETVLDVKITREKGTIYIE